MVRRSLQKQLLIGEVLDLLDLLHRVLGLERLSAFAVLFELLGIQIKYLVYRRVLGLFLRSRRTALLQRHSVVVSVEPIRLELLHQVVCFETEIVDVLGDVLALLREKEIDLFLLVIFLLGLVDVAGEGLQQTLLRRFAEIEIRLFLWPEALEARADVSFGRIFGTFVFVFGFVEGLLRGPEDLLFENGFAADQVALVDLALLLLDAVHSFFDQKGQGFPFI